jgi:hypothetical protein
MDRDGEMAQVKRDTEEWSAKLVGKTLVEDAVAVSEVLPFSYRFLHPNFL